MHLNLIIASLSLFFTISVSSLVFFEDRKNRSNYNFFILGLVIVFWIGSNLTADLIKEYDWALIFIKIAILWGALLPIYFSKTVSNTFSFDQKYKNRQKILIKILWISSFVILILSPTSLNIKYIEFTNSGINYYPGILYYLLFVHLIAGFGFSFIYLYKIYKSHNNPERINSLLILLGCSAAVIWGVTLSIVIPLLGYSWIGIFSPMAALIFTGSISIAITKYNLFKIRVIAIEIITFLLWIFILIRIFLAQNYHELIVELVLFILTIIFGIILIRSTLREVRQKEKIESLNNKLAYLNTNLNRKVAEQTEEIRHSYDLEKHARRELEKLNEAKDQFIMITQHHLRTPATSISWGLESILKGAKGKLETETKNAVEEVSTSTKRLLRIVDDFLAITAIKVGTPILQFSEKSFLPLVEDVLTELKIDIDDKNIAVNMNRDKENWPELRIDENKMREVVLIILENAVKYNVKGGSIDIGTNLENSHFVLNVENTGIALSEEDNEKIFSSLFYRGAEARKLNPIGMGVGLSVSRAIVRAHKGELDIGKNKNGKTRVRVKVPCIN